MREESHLLGQSVGEEETEFPVHMCLPDRPRR
jgi:hypothetical protein